MTAEEQKTIDTLMELKQLLQTENEHLFQQYNHLMIRNQKLMQRIDDQQTLNDKLQGKISGLEQLIDRLRHANIPSSLTVTGNHEVVPSIKGIPSSIDI